MLHPRTRTRQHYLQQRLHLRLGGIQNSAMLQLRRIPLYCSSLILLSPLPGGGARTQDGFDYKVCLLKRNAQMRTAASATVFPGGNLDKADEDASTLLITASADMRTKRMTALKVCVLRETFEECGILLSSPPASFDINEMAVWRKKVSRTIKQMCCSSFRCTDPPNQVYDKPGLFLKLYERLSESNQISFEPPLQSLQ